MKGIQWGFLYNEFKNQKFDSQKLEEQIAELMQDEDITNKKGIYEYLLTGRERHLNIRAFSDNQKRESYERQQGICVKCGPMARRRENKCFKLPDAVQRRQQKEIG